jgi:hypothetical protein
MRTLSCSRRVILSAGLQPESCRDQIAKAACGRGGLDAIAGHWGRDPLPAACGPRPPAAPAGAWYLRSAPASRQGAPRHTQARRRPYWPRPARTGAVPALQAQAKEPKAAHARHHVLATTVHDPGPDWMTDPADHLQRRQESLLDLPGQLSRA